MKKIDKPRHLQLATETVRSLDDVVLSKVGGGGNKTGPRNQCTNACYVIHV